MGFKEAYDSTHNFEGGYVNNPNDKGGPTNYGITEAVARANGFMGDMKDLPKSEAEKIALAQYWEPIKGDAVSVISQKVANELFDSGYLHGIGTVCRWLQESLNELNRNQQDYPDMIVDNVIGPTTLTRFKQYMQKRGLDGELVLLKALNVKQGAKLQGIAQKNLDQEDFLFGWLKNRVQI